MADERMSDLDRALAAIYLQLPQPVATDLSRIVYDRITALERERALLTEQNAALRDSATYCASCGLLAPEHAEGCGRWEVVVQGLERERDALRKALRDIRLMHFPTGSQYFHCPGCGNESPCATAKYIRGWAHLLLADDALRSKEKVP